VRGVLSDAGEQLHLLDRLWKSSTLSIYHSFRGRVKISGARIITQTLPGVERFGFRGAS
jgi:hypothetical protein